LARSASRRSLENLELHDVQRLDPAKLTVAGVARGLVPRERGPDAHTDARTRAGADGQAPRRFELAMTGDVFAHLEVGALRDCVARG
jgi:hypothetical protein